MVFRIMDYTTPREEVYEHVATLKAAAYWFLGECGDFFAAANNNESEDCSHLLQAILMRLQKGAMLGDWNVLLYSISNK
jgi:hypothetical protein